MVTDSDANVDSQRLEHVLANAINTITNWHSFWDSSRILMHPLRPFVQFYYINVVKRYVRKELEQRFTELKAEKQASPTQGGIKRGKSVAAIALQAYIGENKHDNILGKGKLNDDFANDHTSD